MRVVNNGTNSLKTLFREKFDTAFSQMKAFWFHQLVFLAPKNDFRTLINAANKGMIS